MLLYGDSGPLDTFATETYVSFMKSKFVSLHPYFKVHPRKLDAVIAGFPRFVEKTATEKANLFYEFSVSGNDVFCREAYENAEGLLEHLDNVGALLAEMLTMADLARLEVHGPAEEIEKLKVPMPASIRFGSRSRAKTICGAGAPPPLRLQAIDAVALQCSGFHVVRGASQSSRLRPGLHHSFSSPM
jgi:quinol monooxygenase YgiN